MQSFWILRSVISVRQHRELPKFHTDEVRRETHYNACTVNGEKQRHIDQLPQTIVNMGDTLKEGALVPSWKTNCLKAS